MKGSVIIFSRISDKDTKCKHKMSTKKHMKKFEKKREVIYIKKAVLKQFKTLVLKYTNELLILVSHFVKP